MLKRMLAAALAFCTLAVTDAGAYQVPNAGSLYAENVFYCDAELNCSPEALANMLCSLGLFRGTDKGFELDRALRRDEAAALLVRFLGGEKEALSGAWEHPFTDVPDWADGYVGWLYQKGLTKGVSAAEYGARQGVTGIQYATFLTRALNGSDDYKASGMLTQNELENLEAYSGEPLVRSAAVLLSARSLTKPCTANGGSGTLAQALAARDVFSSEQFASAAWDVINPVYREENGKIIASAAGIDIAENTDGLTLDAASASRQDQGVLYASKGGALYALDPKTLAATALGKAHGEAAYLCSLDGRDYLWTGQELLAYTDNALQTILSADKLTNKGFTPQIMRKEPDRYSAWLAITAPNGVYVMYKANTQPLFIETDAAADVIVMENDYIVTVPADHAAGQMHCYDLDAGESTSALDLSDNAEWKTGTNGYLYSTAGLYRVTRDQETRKPVLSQLFAQPVREIEFARWGAGASDPYLLIGEGEDTALYRVKVDYGLAGGQEIRFADYGLTDVTLEGEYDGYDGAPHFFARNGKDAGVYCYQLLEGATEGKIIIAVSGFAPDRTSSSDAEAMTAAEQTRLNALGVGLET